MSKAEHGERATTALTAAVTSLAEHGVPPDIQELLIYGNPNRGIVPGALLRAVGAVLAIQSLAERSAK